MTKKDIVTKNILIGYNDDTYKTDSISTINQIGDVIGVSSAAHSKRNKS